MTDTALLAVLVAAVGGLLAGRAWSASREGSPRQGRPLFRASPHYTQGLHYLATGQLEPATHELAKVLREHPDAVEVQQVLSHLHREVGQVERAIELHRALLARTDLSRAERAHTLASLGTDYRRAGLLDRAAQAYEAQTRLARLRKSDDGLVLAYLQTEMGNEAARAGLWDEAEAAFRTALSLDQRATPAYLALADLWGERDPRRAASILESAIAAVPERAYLTFEPLKKAYASSGEISRFVALCERLIEQDSRDWRARLALARHLRGEDRPGEALGLLLRALEANPHVLLVHLEIWRTLRALGQLGPEEQRYAATLEESALYVDPHICTACRYRADDMLWRCPHCHDWNTFVEERVGPAAGGQV